MEYHKLLPTVGPDFTLRPYTQDFNPADHFLDVISVDYRTSEATAFTTARIEGLVAGCTAGAATRPPLSSI